MDNKKILLIKQFISEIKQKYNLVIGYEYDTENDEYFINHGDSDLQFNNNEFVNYYGKLLKEIFYTKDFFNCSFGYSYDFYIQCIQNYTVNVNSINENITVKSKNSVINQKYSTAEYSFTQSENSTINNTEVFLTNKFIKTKIEKGNTWIINSDKQINNLENNLTNEYKNLFLIQAA